MRSDQIAGSLDQARAAVAAVLHWPNNLGIQFRFLRLQTQPETRALAVFVRGLADAELVQRWVVEPLQRIRPERAPAGPLGPDALGGILPAPDIRAVRSRSAAIRAIFEGATALFLDGSPVAALIGTQGAAARPAGASVPLDPAKETFGLDLLDNVALIRKRLRDPALLATLQQAPAGQGKTALVYLQRRAAPALVEQVRAWIQQHGAEEQLRYGRAAGTPASLGLLPRLTGTQWPDKLAALLEAGYVAVLPDRLPYAYVAPVTASALLHSPGDAVLRRPLPVVLRLMRVALAGIVLAGPAAVVALMNYHPEMMPTPFVLAMASVRENAPFPVIAEMLGLALLQEILREATFRLPVTLSAGNGVIAKALLVLLAVQTGLVGPLPALATLLVVFASLGLPSYELVYMVRWWRFPAIVSAGVFGFFGLASLLLGLAAYLSQAESFGVPFLGAAGLEFSPPEQASGRRERGNGGARGERVR